MSLLMCTQHSKEGIARQSKSNARNCSDCAAEWRPTATHASDIYCSGLLGSLCSHLVATDLLCTFSSGGRSMG